MTEEERNEPTTHDAFKRSIRNTADVVLDAQARECFNFVVQRDRTIDGNFIRVLGYIENILGRLDAQDARLRDLDQRLTALESDSSDSAQVAAMRRDVDWMKSLPARVMGGRYED